MPDSADTDLLFENRAVDNSIAAHLGQSSLETHDHVVPVGIHRRRNVSWARVRLGVGVAMDHAVDFPVEVFCGYLGSHEVSRIDRVDPGGLVIVAARRERRCPIRRRPGKEPTHLERVFVEREAHHRRVRIA